MVEVTTFSYESMGRITDVAPGLDLIFACTVEAQLTTGIAPRPDDITIRHITVHHTNPTDGITPPGWIAFTARLEYVINALITVMPDIQERMELEARAALESGNVTVIGKRESE